MPMSVYDKMRHALTVYDNKQMSKKYHNIYALGMYLEQVGKIEALVNSGAPLRLAICKCFNDRVLACVLKSVGEKAPTVEESRGIHN